MTSGQRFHRLTEEEITAIAELNYSEEVIARLKAAQYSRNALLVETLRRSVRASDHPRVSQVIESAITILSEIQASNPSVVNSLLIMPHFGFWAADCVFQLQQAAAQGRSLSPKMQISLCHIGAFAAAAALLTDHPFELTLPIRDGELYLPSIGRLHIESAEELDYAQIRIDHDTCEIAVGPIRHRVSPRLGTGTTSLAAGWTPVFRVQTSSQGQEINLIIDNSDPFLSQIGPISTSLSERAVETWRYGIRRSWQTLVRHNKELARSLAAGLTTLIPLRSPPEGHQISITSGWAWGAIALSLPDDPVIFAETLIHEYQHLILAAVEDITSLTDSRSEELHYSPWRNDPRPTLNVLQGAYAFLGVTSFWKQQCAIGSPKARRRAEIAFALKRRNVMDALINLSESSELTGTGRLFLRVMYEHVSAWMNEPVSREAEEFSYEIASEHYLRWRLANLEADIKIVDFLAEAWLASPRTSLVALDVPTRLLLSSPVSGLVDRSFLLGYLSGGTDSPPFSTRDANASSSGDLAFMQGDLCQARRIYLHRISQAADPDAWIGLILVLRRLGVINGGWPVRQRIEVVVAVAERVRARTGHCPDAQKLFLWIRRIWGENDTTRS
jgi:HEXXH motif-containing protein